MKVNHYYPGTNSTDLGMSMSQSANDDGMRDEQSESQRVQEHNDGGFSARAKWIWEKIGLDMHTLRMMIRGAIPPTISIAIYQATPIAQSFTSLGYLIPVASILGFAPMPRAKFIQTLIFNVIFVCAAFALSLLMISTAVKARQNTMSALTPSPLGSPAPGPQTFAYSSSASAVAAVWLFFEIYLVSSLRAKFPQFTFPAIIFSMFTNIASGYAPQFMTVTAGISFLTRLTGAFLLGLAITAGTSFFVFPDTSRKIIFKQMAEYISALRGTLEAHANYFESMEHNDMFGRAETFDQNTEKRGKKGKKIYSPEAEAIKTSVRRVTKLHGDLHTDLTFAKREIALGYLGPDDLKDISNHLRRTMVTSVGLSSVVDIFERLSEYNRWNQPFEEGPDIHSDAAREHIVREWNDLMRAVHEPFASMIRDMDEGLQHVAYRLRLSKRRRTEASRFSERDTAKRTIDAEAALSTAPGKAGFADYLEMKTKEFQKGKEVALRAWCGEKGIKIPANFFEHPESAPLEVPEEMIASVAIRERNQRQLYILLYMENLLYSTSQAILQFARFADDRVECGKLSKLRLIIPGSKRLKKWVYSSFQAQDSQEDNNVGEINSQNDSLLLGEAYRTRRDPEHLPPETLVQKIGDWVRIIPKLLRSSESAFGFRVACATMSIAIGAFLQSTQVFFIRQRLVWAQIMVAISMSPTAGQSIFSFVLRVLGTIAAMIASLLIWYIPGGETPGVVIFHFLLMASVFYAHTKKPHFVIMIMICAMTISMIVAYELEVRKIGEEAATANGQAYYPINMLAPYRLATVVAGLFVAFVWTVFPYPISEHSILRQSLGASLYLLANYYSIIHETVSARIRGDEGDMALKTSAGGRLERARHRLYTKQALMLNKLHTYSDFLKWEIPIGGRFPKRQYIVIIQCMQNIVNYVSLVEYASRAFTPSNDDDCSERAWLQEFKKLMASAYVTTHQITSLLALLSASIANRQPLPPYLTTPRPYGFAERLKELDNNILSIRHSAEPSYAAFSVLQISTRCIIGDLEKLMTNVKVLVGELDFSFHFVSPTIIPGSGQTSFSLSRSEKQDKED